MNGNGETVECVRVDCNGTDAAACVEEVTSRVSNGTGQCNFSGQRDRQKNFVPGQRDNGITSKSYHGTEWAGTAKIQDRTGRDSQNPRRDTGQDGTEQKRTF